MDGLVELNTLHPENLLPGRHDAVIASGVAGLDDVGTELLVAPSAVVDYRLRMPDSYSLAVGFDIDFSPQGLGGNVARIGDYFNRIQLAGGSEAMAPVVIDLFNHPDVDSLSETYSYMNPAHYDNFTQGALEVSWLTTQMLHQRIQTQRLIGTLMGNMMLVNSVRAYDGEILLASTGSDMQVAKMFTGSKGKQKVSSDQGLWLNVAATNGIQDKNEDFSGYELDAWAMLAGYDRQVGSQALAGLSFGYSRTRLELYDHWGRGDIESYHLSVYGSYYPFESFYLDGSLAYARQDYDNQRLTRVMGDYRLAESEHDGNAFSAYAEIGGNFLSENLLFQPYVSLNYVYLEEGRSVEDGADALSLRVNDRTTNSLQMDLGVRLSGNYEIKAGILSPKLTFAFSRDFNIDNRQVTASFDGYPNEKFTVDGLKRSQGRVHLGLGLHFLSHQGVSSSLSFRSTQQSGYRANELVGEVSIKF